MGDLGLIPGLGWSPWRRERQPTPVFRPREFHGVAKSQTRLSNFNFRMVNFLGFPSGAIGKESACQCRRQKRFMRLGFDPCIRKIPGRRKRQFPSSILPCEIPYSSWGLRRVGHDRVHMHAGSSLTTWSPVVILDLNATHHTIRFHLVLPNCFPISFTCVHCTSRDTVMCFQMCLCPCGGLYNVES